MDSSSSPIRNKNNSLDYQHCRSNKKLSKSGGPNRGERDTHHHHHHHHHQQQQSHHHHHTQQQHSIGTQNRASYGGQQNQQREGHDGRYSSSNNNNSCSSNTNSNNNNNNTSVSERSNFREGVGREEFTSVFISNYHDSLKILVLMRPTDTNPSIRDLLTNDILLSIFDKLSIVHRKRLSRVCKRWKELIDITFLWVRVFSAVDDRRCVTNWQPSNWWSLESVSQRQEYIRIPKISASEILSRTAERLPNLTGIDLECCDMNSRIIRTILDSCKKVERINLDSSTRLNYYSFHLMVQDWKRLKHINLSCCTEVSEVSASFLITSLDQLESLNLCGTRISGLCLDKLNPNMKRLDISYCWGVQQEGLNALARAPCRMLVELSVNNFDFDGSESCMIRVFSNFPNLKHLQMSIGPCVAHDYFIDRITCRGFSAISKLKQLETLIIEKICILDNAALLSIIRHCSKLKRLRLNLGWLNFCNDHSFVGIDKALPDLEELHISYPSALSCAGLTGLANLKKLKALSLVNTNIDNDIFRFLDKIDNLTSLNFDDCRKITLRGLNHLCRIASKRPEQTINASLLGTGISVARVRTRRNLPMNLKAQISNFRATRYHLQLPPPVIDV